MFVSGSKNMILILINMTAHWDLNVDNISFHFKVRRNTNYNCYSVIRIWLLMRGSIFHDMTGKVGMGCKYYYRRRESVGVLESVFCFPQVARGCRRQTPFSERTVLFPGNQNSSLAPTVEDHLSSSAQPSKSRNYTASNNTAHHRHIQLTFSGYTATP